MFLFVLLFWWINPTTCVLIPISQSSGVDNTSCLNPNGTLPCRTIRYALAVLNDENFDHECAFTFSIQDKYYDLRKQIQISQPRADRQISLTTADNNSESVISCGFEFSTICGIIIGKETGNKTHNIHLANIEFQNFRASSSAIVTIRNAVNASFTNCVFRDNKRCALIAFDSGVSIENCRFSNNNPGQPLSNDGRLQALAGGAKFLFENASDLNVIVRNTVFMSNAVVLNNSEIYVEHSTFPEVCSRRSGRGDGAKRCEQEKQESRRQAIFPEAYGIVGGGLSIVFRGRAHRNKVFIENTSFSENQATSGGGVYYADHSSDSGRLSGNEMEIQKSSFAGNRALHDGGGMMIQNSSGFLLVKDCVFKENWALIGGGVNVGQPFERIQFDNVTWDGNKGQEIPAIRLMGNLRSEAEFINCTVKNHSASYSTYSTYTSPLTTFQMRVVFTGINVFTENYGTGAMENLVSSVHLKGILKFIENSGVRAGAVFSMFSSITLHPGSKLIFVRNHCYMVGGAITIFGGRPYDFVPIKYNPYCFIRYSERNTGPSKWKVKVSFVENSAAFQGAAVYIPSLQQCSWNEEYPFHSVAKALRWNNSFEYRDNFLLYGKNFNRLSGPEYDIATDLHHFHPTGNISQVKLSPGEVLRLSIRGYDELNHTIFTIASLTEHGSFDIGHNSLYLSNPMRLLSPLDDGSFNFAYYLANETVYKEMEKYEVHHFHMDNVYSVFRNTYTFNVTAIPCKPGFKFKGTRCHCDKTIEGVLRCGIDGRTVYLKKSYWGEVENGRLATYWCPYQFCHCKSDGDLPGCKFDPDRVDGQCAHNRTGILCGRCKKNFSVGLNIPLNLGFSLGLESLADCTECEGWPTFFVIGIQIIGILIFISIIIAVNPRMSSDLRGPLFFLQIVFIVLDPNGIGWNFDFFQICAVKEMTSLGAVAMGYLFPFTTIIVFLFLYMVSAKFYLVRFKRRKNSILRSFWLLTLLAYNNLAITSFILLFCIKVGKKNLFFYDATIECFEGEHLLAAILASFALLLMVILLISVVLVTKRYWRVDPQYFDTLTDGLSPRCSWWWSWDLFRRVLLMVFYVFIPDWYIKQVILFMICSVILAIHNTLQPYKKKRVNALESVYLTILAVMAVMPLLKAEDTSDITGMKKVVSSLLLISTMILTLVLFACKLVRLLRGKGKPSERFVKLEEYESIEESSDINLEQRERKQIFGIIFG